MKTIKNLVVCYYKNCQHLVGVAKENAVELSLFFLGLLNMALTSVAIAMVIGLVFFSR